MNRGLRAVVLIWGLLLFTQAAQAADYTKIRAVYNYYTTEENFLLFKDQGINAVILKNEYDNNLDYGTPIQIPERIKKYAQWAKEYDMMYFQGINFSHYHFANGTKPSIIPGIFNTIYEDGASSGQVSPWSESFWSHLTDMVVALASFAKYNSANYRIDGVFLDFEMYNDYDEPTNFDQKWGFEDQTFIRYIKARGLGGMAPPIGPSLDERSKRKTWLSNNGKLDDYYAFLNETIYIFAKRLKDKVKDENSDFIIGAYPSCGNNKYLSSIYSGFSSVDQPMIVWATETYGYGERGEDALPNNLKGCRLTQGYYDLTSIYGKPIYGWYVGGLLLRKYAYLNFDYYLYQIAKDCNGYWIFSTLPLIKTFEELQKPELAGYRLLYFEPLTRVRRLCENAIQHNRAKRFCWQEIKSANRELDRLLSNSSYQTYLSYDLLSDGDKLNPLIEGAQNVTLDPLRLRGQHVFIIKAAEGAKVEMQIAAYRVASCQDLTTFEVRDPNGKMITQGTINPNTEGLISFVAPGTCNYSVAVKPGFNCFSVLKVNVPLMIFSLNKIHFFQAAGNIMFYVGDISSFTLSFEGGGNSVEGLTATIYQPIPDGYRTFISGSTSQDKNSFSLTVTVPVEARNKIWKTEVSKPSVAGQYLEDAYISFDLQLGSYFGVTDNPAFFMRKDTAIAQYGNVSGELVSRYTVGLKDLSDAAKTLADVSGDGQTSTFDAALIGKRAVGLMPRFPVEE